MAKIIDLIREDDEPDRPFFSFEFFPPKTDIGTVNLYERIERMSRVNPLWIDVTWKPETKGQTLEICRIASQFYGVNVMMHLTCANATKRSIRRALECCKQAGIKNLLALRGDLAPTDEGTTSPSTSGPGPVGSVNSSIPSTTGQGNDDFQKLKGERELSVNDLSDCSSSEERTAAKDKGITATQKPDFEHAVDLVRFIREEEGNYFCIAVAGYPEGHLEAASFEQDMKFLKEKIDAGADFVVTQLFYEVSAFVKFVRALRKIGVDTEETPVLPGIMPIQSYNGFCRMTENCKTQVPDDIVQELELIKDNDQMVKNFGVEQCIKMCTELLTKNPDVKPRGLHFYTLNLETAVLRVINGMELFDWWRNNRKLPWRPGFRSSGNLCTSSGHGNTAGSTSNASPGGQHHQNQNDRDVISQSPPADHATKLHHQTSNEESVRPIFWANRPQSYLYRTASWDDFPNGRFGNKDSPAYGDFSTQFVSYSKESLTKVRQDRRNMWGEELSNGLKSIATVFVKFLQNDPKVKKLPWNTEAPTKETNFILPQLCKLNLLEIFTINSQPRVNATLSNDPFVGWGPPGGFVYQKGYIEFFISPTNLHYLLEKIDEEKLKSWRYTAINRSGSKKYTNNSSNTICAITWGVFPSSEVIQPTVCDDVSFEAWKDEAFELWDLWSSIYPENSPSKLLISQTIKQTWFLMNIVDNDFVSGDLFSTLVELMDANAAKAWRQNCVVSNPSSTSSTTSSTYTTSKR
ncbi:unnamed protein product [Amoebophrya sp. A120]|nr:unnamed protein product [Amoebophrya sp. A120]|eukprot:GSA120T00016633001.1